MSTLGSPVTQMPLWRRIVAPPSTRSGRRAAWLVAAAMLALAGTGGLVAAGVADWGWAAQAALVIAGLVAVAGAIASCALAVRAIAQGERSILELAPLLFGGVCFVFLVGALLGPF